MVPLVPKFLRICEQGFDVVQALGLVTLKLAEGSSQCALVSLAELHCCRVCRKGVLWLSLSVCVPEQSQFCHRHIPWASPVDTAWQHQGDVLWLQILAAWCWDGHGEALPHTR